METNKLDHYYENGDIVDVLFGDEDTSNSKTDDETEEMFNSHVHPNLTEGARKALFDKAFEKYDLYERFPTQNKPEVTQTSSPLLVSSPVLSKKSPWKYITEETRRKWRNDALEGQKDFCKVLLKKGIDPEEYSPHLKRWGKNSTEKPDFDLKTPISGEIILPPEAKSKILEGLVCFVDVRCESQRCANKAVEAELRALGATIVKSVTKKVTHVIFKEGYRSTYIKATKEGVPLVSVGWIEACKGVRGIADPAQHPPAKLDKYKNILPFQTIKRRRLKFYNPNSKIRKLILENFNDPLFIPTLNGKELARRAKAAAIRREKAASIEDEQRLQTENNKPICEGNLQEDKAKHEEAFPSCSSSFHSIHNMEIEDYERNKNATGETTNKKEVTETDTSSVRKRARKTSDASKVEHRKTRRNIIPNKKYRDFIIY